jgi:hypothetical protein
MDREQQVLVVHAGHRSEVAHQVVGLLRDERLVHRVRVRHHENRVAVGRRLRDRVGADDRAAAGTVLDHHGMAERSESFAARTRP